MTLHGISTKGDIIHDVKIILTYQFLMLSNQNALYLAKALEQPFDG